MESLPRAVHDPGCERTDAFADCIHDLRSAATAMGGWVEVLRRVGEDEHERELALTAMRRNLAAMRRAFDLLATDREHDRQAAG